MYKLLIILFMLCTVKVYGQTINGKELKDIDTKYLIVTCIKKGFNSQVYAWVEYGQLIKTTAPAKDNQIKDHNGKPILFNAVVSVFIFMDKLKYKYKNAYVSNNIQRFVFERIE